MLTKNELYFAKVEIRKCARKVHTKINEHSEGEPMDGDETAKLADYLLIELDWLNGNITNSEYDERLRKINLPTYYVNGNEAGGRKKRDD